MTVAIISDCKTVTLGVTPFEITVPREWVSCLKVTEKVRKMVTMMLGIQCHRKNRNLTKLLFKGRIASNLNSSLLPLLDQAWEQEVQYSRNLLLYIFLISALYVYDSKRVISMWHVTSIVACRPRPQTSEEVAATTTELNLSRDRASA